MYYLFFTHLKDPVTSWSFRRNSINVPEASGTRFDHDPWTGYPRIQYTRLVVVVVIVVVVVVVVVVVGIVGEVAALVALAVCFI
jgi:hypothetical protein